MSWIPCQALGHRISTPGLYIHEADVLVCPGSCVVLVRTGNTDMVTKASLERRHIVGWIWEKAKCTPRRRGFQAQGAVGAKALRPRGCSGCQRDAGAARRKGRSRNCRVNGV